jgi:hypothetical protein
MSRSPRAPPFLRLCSGRGTPRFFAENGGYPANFGFDFSSGTGQNGKIGCGRRPASGLLISNGINT